MNKQHIQTDNNGMIFIIKFYFDTNIHIVYIDSILDVLKQDETGIEYIKRMEVKKGNLKPVRISKKDFRSCISYNTELDIYLNTHYYFN